MSDTPAFIILSNLSFFFIHRMKNLNKDINGTARRLNINMFFVLMKKGWAVYTSYHLPWAHCHHTVTMTTFVLFIFFDKPVRFEFISMLLASRTM